MTPHAHYPLRSRDLDGTCVGRVCSSGAILLLLPAGNSRQLWATLGICGQLWAKVGNSRQLWATIGNCGQQWAVVGNCGQGCMYYLHPERPCFHKCREMYAIVCKVLNVCNCVQPIASSSTNKQTNKNLRCGNRKGLLGRNDQTHHRMGPKTMESIPPSKRNTQADIQLRTRQTNHQQETDGCSQIKHNPEHQPSRMSRKSTAYVPPKTASTPTKANTQTCSYLDFNQFLIRRITRNICLRLRIKQIQILTCREQDIR